MDFTDEEILSNAFRRNLMPTYQCKRCLAKLEIKRKENKEERNITFDPKITPYGGPYPHQNTLECPLLQGLTEEELSRITSIEKIR